MEVAGRWFGVRGRRFVRPTLTLVHKGAEVRALADLEHKPWAAVDGEVWTAAFSVDEGLDDAREIELSVAPDIVVELRPKGKKLARPGDSLAAGAAARAPRFKQESALPPPPAPDRGPTPDAPAEPAPRRRPPSVSVELERLGSRLASANDALEQERERRSALGRSLEDERTANRQLRTELGQARAQLEVAATARAEATAMEAELEDARRQLREAQRRHETDAQALTRRHEEVAQALARDHEQATQAHAAVQEELDRQTEALDAMREALAAERTEAGRLRNRLAQLQQAREHADAGAAEPEAGPAEARPTRRARSREGSSREAPSRPASSRQSAPRHAEPSRGADPTETQPFDVMELSDELEASTPSRRSSSPSPSSSSSRRASRRGHQAQDPPAWAPPTAERLRPLNPSLRHRTWWFARILALVVLCGVIAAVWAVLHSTVLH